MQTIKIHNLGPIKECEMGINDFMVLTGPQASGKSTLAKSIFFFKNVKNLLLMQIRKKMLMPDAGGTIEMSCKRHLIRDIRAHFLQTFGSTWCMDNDMRLSYQYMPGREISISLTEDKESPNYIWIDLSDEFSDFLSRLDQSCSKKQWLEEEIRVKLEVEEFFDDRKEVIYIPAGRSLITLLSSQLNYIYSSMDDLQKRSLDYCLQNYLERILRMKADYTTSYSQMIKDQIYLTDQKVDRVYLQTMAELMTDILKGEYRNVAGEERLQVSGRRYVKLNYASSGQQEVVWILNVLFYHLLHRRTAFFIIEEPESHLYPDAQKKVAQFISSVKYAGNQILVTTHSPYILGELNNLLYAGQIAGGADEQKLKRIVNEYQRIEFSGFSAYYFRDGGMESCIDREFNSIKNEVIDGASDDINNEFAAMVDLAGRG